MTATLFTEGWTFLRTRDAEPENVRLPHDAMIGEPRSADAATGNHGGYFPGGSYLYERDWTVPDDIGEQSYSLFFEGVYGDTVVSVDGVPKGECRSGYREFSVPLSDLEPGATARITVAVDNTQTPNSRWYTGSGIYRPIWLESVPATHIARDGIRFVTRTVGGEAIVDVEIHIEGPDAGTTVVVELGRDGVIGARGQFETRAGVASGQLAVPAARTWSADDPFLYDATVQLITDDGPIDEQRLRVGLRTIELDTTRGLRVNGEPVLLRGACIHHDSGILGAATFASAEHRRARILKENGYNAIRSSHQPLSRAFLDACDELGLYVMDELTDVWLAHKTSHDTAERFEELWPDDARSMIAKDRNRPSVIMYSLGNEIAETATEAGVAAASRIDAFFTELDATRPTTLAINLLLNLMASKGKSAFDREKQPATAEKPTATSTAANLVTAKLGKVMNLVSRLPAADKASREAFAAVDIAGYNYAYGRYAADRKRYPNRVIVGSESMPGDLPAIWRQVERVPGVIGDFMWTGWDYLGESGIGVWSYGKDAGGLNKPYPALLAGPGAFDITGVPGAPAFLAQAVWGRLSAPAITVRPLDRAGERANKTPWRTSDAIASWSWRGLAGHAEIEVYSDDDHVELLLNGRSLGRKRAGRKVAFVTHFRAIYEPGELVAIGYRRGIETGRTSLRSAERAQLRLHAEEAGPSADGLSFVWVEIADENGIVDSAASDRISLTIDGPAVLAAFGSADPAPLDSYVADTQTTYHGRTLAIIRTTGAPGTVTISATSTRHGDATLTRPAARQPMMAIAEA
jgi:hypothetical protein